MPAQQFKEHLLCRRKRKNLAVANTDKELAEFFGGANPPSDCRADSSTLVFSVGLIRRVFIA